MNKSGKNNKWPFISQCIFALIFCSVFANNLIAQPGRPTEPVVLAADDTAAFAHAPEAFDKRRADILKGKTGSV